MEIKSMHFKANVSAKLADAVLQGNLKNAKGKFVTKRAEALRDLDDFEGTRDAAKAIRNKVIDNLDLSGGDVRLANSAACRSAESLITSMKVRYRLPCDSGRCSSKRSSNGTQWSSTRRSVTGRKGSH